MSGPPSGAADSAGGGAADASNTVRVGPYEIGSLVVLAGLFTVLLVRSWRKWPDILVDFGHELYVPWQLSAGQVLYRDVAHFFGPLSPYFNAFLFKVFGVSFTVLFVANIVMLAAFVAFLYYFLRRISSPLTAFVCCAVVIAVFAFPQYTLYGNYNFITPYTHEATHGIFLSFAVLSQLSRFALDNRGRRLALAGILTGLVFLTKPEIFLAVFLAASFFFLLSAAQTGGLRKTGRYCGLFLPCAFVPPLAFWGYLSTVMPSSEALRGILGPWALMSDSSITGSRFYLACTGFNDVAGNLRVMAGGGLLALSALIPGLLHIPASQRLRDAIRYLGAAGVCAVVIVFGDLYLVRAVPLLDTFAFLVLCMFYFGSSPGEQRERTLPLLLLSVFSATLLGKILLNCRLYDYGFYLVMPSALLLIVMTVWLIPQWLDGRGLKGSSFRAAALVVIALLTWRYMRLSNSFYERKDYPVGRGDDTIVAFNPGVDRASPLTARAIGWLSSNLRKGETFIVLPEGVMLNYQTRRLNPSRYTLFMPAEVGAYGEDNIIRDFGLRPPDYIVLVQKDTAEYGAGAFGRDAGYGGNIMRWVEKNYSRVCLFGDDPLTGVRFGIEIMRKRNQKRGEI